MRMKRWTVSSLDKEHAAKIAEEMGLPFFLAMMLEIRGVREPDQIMDLLGERESFPDPFSLSLIHIFLISLSMMLNPVEPS